MNQCTLSLQKYINVMQDIEEILLIQNTPNPIHPNHVHTMC